MPALLRTDNLQVAFDGVKAADGIDLEIRTGEFVAIIGPNGSGKTTFLNLCTGYVRASAGHVYLEERDITRLSPRAIARRGIARAFQLPQLFTEHTLIENVMMALAARHGFWDPVRPLDRAAWRHEATGLLKLVDLSDVAEQRSSEMAEGVRKLTDIVIALALKPRLLLLDEPTSGVSASEKFALMEILVAALRAASVTALFVEHDMEIVRRYADRILVWDTGRIMAEGDPETVLNDPYVLENVVGME